jgi:hypothetical protein
MQGHSALWAEPPVPQVGDPDHYEFFIQRIAKLYTQRFSVLP